METVQLAPLSDEFLAVWVREILPTEGLRFDLRSPALELFLDAVQGHLIDEYLSIIENTLGNLHRVHPNASKNLRSAGILPASYPRDIRDACPTN